MLTLLFRPVPRNQSDSKGTYAQHLDGSAPSSPGNPGLNGDGEFTELGGLNLSAGELDYQKLLATGLMTPTHPSDNEQSRMTKQSGPGGPERSTSPQSDTSTSSTLKLRDYRPEFLKTAPSTEDDTNREADRDPASGLRYSTIQNFPRHRAAAYAGSDIDAPTPLDALKTPMPRPCAPVMPSGEPKVLWRTCSPPSSAEVSDDDEPMPELHLPAQGPLSSRGPALAASYWLDSLGRPAPGKGKSQWRGVSWHNNKWRATMTHCGKTHHLGNFCTQEEAAEAYDVAALTMKGPDARTNFQASDYGVVWNVLDARPRQRAPARKRRSPDNSPSNSPGASGGPPTDAHPVQRAAKRRRGKAAEGAEVVEEAMDEEAEFEVLPKAVQNESRAQRAKRRAAAAGNLQVDGSTAAPVMLGRLGQLPPIPEDAEPEPDTPNHGAPTAPTPPSAAVPGRALHRSARKRGAPVRSHLD
ncbi:probable AP2-like ethylene-responsive transcription factor AIL5 at C-terminar half [Coccomyxa sp. Obi]|nr:probable AP2-like ethylene-responsive transcription factor AIL5 at C-terminar half [Coccomyxa sp. Obi]